MQVTSLDQFDAAVETLSVTRSNLVLGAKTASNLIKDYAEAMCAMFDVVDANGARVKAWYELKGKAKAGVKAERAVFAAAMQESGFGTGTTDVYWQRVKEASGYVTAGNRVKGAVNVDEKTLSELKTIINRIFQAEQDGDATCDKASECKGALMDIYETMGGNIDDIDTTE
jgi:hypothetical protein